MVAAHAALPIKPGITATTKLHNGAHGSTGNSCIAVNRDANASTGNATRAGSTDINASIGNPANGGRIASPDNDVRSALAVVALMATHITGCWSRPKAAGHATRLQHHHIL